MTVVFVQSMRPRRDRRRRLLVASKSQGGQVIDEAPRPGSPAKTVAFVHLKGALVAFIELVQE